MPDPGSIALGVNSASLGVFATSSVPDPGADGVAQLTAQLVAGAEEAFRTLHDRYHRRLERYLIVVCRGEESAARDALQETWIRVVRHAKRFQSEAELWRWLAALARCAAVDGSRRRNRYRAALTRYLAWLRPIEPRPDPEDVEARLNHLDVLLEQGLDALPPADRGLLVARYREGRSVRDLAVVAGVSEKAMESRLGRLRSHLRQQLLTRLADEDNPSA